MNLEELQEYDFSWFWFRYLSAKHDESLLELADELPEVNNKNVFLFSTAGLTVKFKTPKDHA